MTENNISTAIRAEVPFGERVIEGYLLPSELWTNTNKFGVSKTQAALLAYPNHDRSQASVKYLQAVKSKVAQKFAPQGIQVHSKIKTEGKKGDASRVDLLPLDSLVIFLKVCKKLGSEDADVFIDDLVGLSLQQIFSDAFGFKFEQEDRQEWIKWRGKTRIDFHPVLTKSIEKNLNPESGKEWGKYIWQFQDALGIESGTRDKLPSEKLMELAIAQNTAAALLDAGVNWKEVLRKIAA